MRCTVCKKIVPSSYSVCPFCGGEVTESHDVVVDAPNDGSNISNAIVETKVTKYTSIIIGAGVGVIVLYLLYQLVQLDLQKSLLLLQILLKNIY